MLLKEKCQPFLDAMEHFPDVVRVFVSKVRELFSVKEAQERREKEEAERREPFGILFNLILERTQIFGSAATLATLEVGKAMLPVSKVRELFSVKEAQERREKEEAERRRQAEREARKQKNRSKGWER
mgnify:CR=1 FL=1